MAAIPPQLRVPERIAIEKFDSDYSTYIPWAGISAAAGGFLLTGALIVIVSASLCLALPNINVIQHVLLPGILPGSLALLASIPFLVVTFLLQRKMNKIRDPWLKRYEDILEDPIYNFDALADEEKIEFVADVLLEKSWGNDCKKRIITELDNRLPNKKLQTPRQQEISKIYDKAKERIDTPPDYPD